MVVEQSYSHTLAELKKEEDKPGLSLRPVAERLSNLLNKPVTFVPVTEGKQLEDAIDNMKNGDVLLVQTPVTKTLRMANM